MNRILDLGKLSTPQLLAIRSILAGGAEATAETAKVKRLKQLEAENAELKRKESRHVVLADIGIDVDDDESYWLGLSDYLFNFVVKKCFGIKKETAIASTTMTMKIPQVGTEPVLNTYEAVREGLKARRNGG
jgi:hypothetical protein